MSTTHPQSRSPLVALPPELLFCIAEEICWDAATGWYAPGVVPFAQTCQVVLAAVNPLVRCGIQRYSRWPMESVIEPLRISQDYHTIRCIAVNTCFHDCDAACAAADSTCIASFVALCVHSLVHLDLYNTSDACLYELARIAGTFPRVRYLSLGGGTLSIGALADVARRCPALEILMPISLHPGDHDSIPAARAPFRLRRLGLMDCACDVAAVAWLCGASGDTLQDLALSPSIEPRDEMAWIAGITHILARLPSLSVSSPISHCLSHILRFTPRLLHLTAHIDMLPPLDSLPCSLRSLTLTGPRLTRRTSVAIEDFVATHVGKQPSNFKAIISLDEQLQRLATTSDRTWLTENCDRFGIRSSWLPA